MVKPDLFTKQKYPKVPNDAIQLVLRNIEGKNVTTSLIVAEVFNKQNKHVLESIANLSCSKEFKESNFRLCLRTIKLDVGQSRQRYYEITKDGFSFLVMGYTGSKASRFKEMFIKEFNKREAMLKNDDYILNRAMGILSDRVRALESTLDKNKVIIADQSYAIVKQLPKVNYHDRVLQSKSGFTTTTIAKELGMSAIKLNRILHEKKIIYYIDKHWVLYSYYDNRGYMITRTTPYKDGEVIYTSIDSQWTEKGRRFIHMIINKELREKTN